MITLVIMRHGQAEPVAASDAERALTPEGQRQACLVGQQLHLAQIPLEGILASPYRRAQQSAEAVNRAWPCALTVQTCPWLTPESPAEGVLEWLPTRGSWLLVSHMPLVGQLSTLLLDGERHRPLHFQTAMAIELTTAWPASGLASQKRLFTP